MLPLHLVIIGACEAELAEFHLPNGVHLAGFSRISNPQRTPLAAIGNRFLNAAKAEVIGICHADTTFGPGALEMFTKEAIAGNVTGIVGIDASRTYRWSRENPGMVSTLDSCSVFLRADLGLRFDAHTFDGLHCHIPDLCVQAHMRGIGVIVPPASADHLGGRTLLPEWQAEFRYYETRMRDKWRGIEYQLT